MGDPLLTENPDRFTLLPIVYRDVYKMYKNMVSVRWIAEEVDMSKDRAQFEALGPGEKHFITCILGFFAGSDGVVNENLCANFANEIQIPEARAFYTEQMANETVHGETYGLLIDTYISDPVEKRKTFHAIRTMPFVAKKAEWAMKWITSKKDFAHRLLAFAIVEGVFFSGAFCAIYWFKQRNVLPGLTVANEFISRDEGLHTDFACLLYSKLQQRLTTAEAHAMFEEAIAIEREFIIEALPCSLIGMNAALMEEYIKFVADRLLQQTGYPKRWSAQNPFSFMERICLEGKDNFFEKRVTNYSLAMCDRSSMEFSTDAEF